VYNTVRTSPLLSVTRREMLCGTAVPFAGAAGNEEFAPPPQAANVAAASAKMQQGNRRIGLAFQRVQADLTRQEPPKD
jgi:hypothetical protein